MRENNVNNTFRNWYESRPINERKLYRNFVFSSIFIDEKTIQQKRDLFHNMKYGKSRIKGIIRKLLFEKARELDNNLITISQLFPEYEN